MIWRSGGRAKRSLQYFIGMDSERAAAAVQVAAGAGSGGTGELWHQITGHGQEAETTRHDRPRKRHQIQQACPDCRVSKSKCTDERPCPRCIRRHREASCLSDDVTTGLRGQRKRQTKPKNVLLDTPPLAPTATCNSAPPPLNRGKQVDNAQHRRRVQFERASWKKCFCPGSCMSAVVLTICSTWQKSHPFFERCSETNAIEVELNRKFGKIQGQLAQLESKLALHKEAAVIAGDFGRPAEFQVDQSPVMS